jgi:hypothetical protein
MIFVVTGIFLLSSKSFLAQISFISMRASAKHCTIRSSVASSAVGYFRAMSKARGRSSCLQTIMVL